MFNANSTMIDAFVGHIQAKFHDAFPNAPTDYCALLENAARTALEIMLGCDCAYHDVQHTILVTDIGQTMLQGRQVSNGDLDADDWLHAVLAMLFHDVGYVRDLLPADSESHCVIDAAGNQVALPPGCTDAFLTPYHVERSCLYVEDRFAGTSFIDESRLRTSIAITLFPVSRSAQEQPVGIIPALVRAADLLGQMADPQYLKKLPRLYAEFVETGEAERQNFANPGELRARFPEFFESQVRPFVSEGLRSLGRIQDGQQWLANLYHHLHTSEEVETSTRAEIARLVRVV